MSDPGPDTLDSSTSDGVGTLPDEPREDRDRTLFHILVSGGLVALVLIAWPGSMFPSWTPRVAVLAVLGTVGLVPLARAARASDRASQLAAVLIASAIVVGSFGPARSVLLGYVGRDQSVAILVLSLGCWALGRSGWTRSSTSIFVVSSAIGALVGIVQVVAQVEGGAFGLQSGRPPGLMINPVYFGAVCAAGCVAAIAHVDRPLDLWSTLCIVATSTAVGLSGSRVALLATIVVIGGVAVSERTRRVTSGAFVALVGVGVSAVIDASVPANSSASSRLASSGLDGRLTVWRYGLDAWLDEPIWGHGFGRFRAATQELYSSEFATEYAPDDRLQAWFDPHNVIVLVLVSSGVIGFVLVAAWTTSAVRQASGPLGWAALAIVATWSLQPVSIHTLPLAMLLVGLAMAHGSQRSTEHAVDPLDREVDTGPPRLAALGALAVAVGVASWAVIGDLRLDRVTDELAVNKAEQVGGWYWRDPVVADIVAQVHELRGDGDGWLQWQQRAVDWEPDRPYWWSRLGVARAALGDPDGAEQAFDQALELQPANVRAQALRRLLDDEPAP